MSLPMIQFKATNTDLEMSLQDLVETKFQSLDKFIGDETDVRIEVEFVKETAHQSGKHFRVNSNLHLHGHLYRAEATELSFEEAVDEVRAELDKELRRANKKRETMVKRGGRALKRMMRRN